MTLLTSRMFMFHIVAVHVKIKTLTFQDKIFVTNLTVEDFLPTDCERNFCNKPETNK